MDFAAWRRLVKPVPTVAQVETQRRDALAPNARPVTTNEAATQRSDQSGCSDAASNH